ncbi:MAG: NADP-dependent malic enzyme [Candidatus Micrarchaeota archaeon]|nr:NADP-dependent malic enzyme [Candidatus Micrarchaeota archaeon]
MEDPVKYHRKLRGKIELKVKDPAYSMKKLALAYTPGVASACSEISKNLEEVYELTNKWNSVAVISDGTRVLGLGNIGPYAAIPVMEGKAMLFKQFGNVDAFPICLNERDENRLIEIIKAIEPVFGGINLEDIQNPKCFYLERKLYDLLDIPVFHDDQHGTAITLLAGLLNALKVLGLNKNLKIVINGVGAAGNAITNILLNYGFKNIVCIDSKGILSTKRKDLNEFKLELAKKTNPENLEGELINAVDGASVIISTAGPNTINEEHVNKMADKRIVFALSNPVPDLDCEKAKRLKIDVFATGRSDCKNQINNLLAFPGVFRGALDATARKINYEMKIAAAEAIADFLDEPSKEMIIPSPLVVELHEQVAIEVGKKAIETNITRKKLNYNELVEKIKKNIKKKQ